MKTGLVLEGGGLRVLFSVGIMDVMMDHGIRFDGIIGVSAGAAMVAAVTLASRDSFESKNIVVVLADAINNYISEL